VSGDVAGCGAHGTKLSAFLVDAASGGRLDYAIARRSSCIRCRDLHGGL
jgi:hypothetical protein